MHLQMSIDSKKMSHFSKQEIEYLSRLRILKNNLVHVHGFPKSIAKKNILESNEYFGQYGKIIRLFVTYKINPDNNKKVYSAYITYSNEKEAALAILCVDSLLIDGKIIRAFFGTTKYCNFFLNNKKCQNINKCLFLHKLINDKDIIINDNTNFSYNEHIKLSKKIIKYFDQNTKDIIAKKIKPKNIKFPFLDFIFLSEEEKENYFSSGNISYVHINSNKLNNNLYNESKNQLFNNLNKNNTNKYIFCEHKINSEPKFNSLFSFKDYNIYSNPNSFNNNNHNLFNFEDLYKLLQKSIKHIMLMKPFYIKMDSIPLKKLELDYFQKELEKNGTNLHELFDGCLDSIKDIL